jgi:hypothetical protein
MPAVLFLLVELGLCGVLTFIGTWMAGSPRWWAEHVPRVGLRGVVRGDPEGRAKGIRAFGVTCLVLAAAVFGHLILTMVRIRGG